MRHNPIKSSLNTELRITIRLTWQKLGQYHWHAIKWIDGIKIELVLDGWTYFVIKALAIIKVVLRLDWIIQGVNKLFKKMIMLLLLLVTKNHSFISLFNWQTTFSSKNKKLLYIIKYFFFKYFYSIYLFFLLLYLFNH